MGVSTVTTTLPSSLIHITVLCHMHSHVILSIQYMYMYSFDQSNNDSNKIKNLSYTKEDRNLGGSDYIFPGTRTGC